MEVFTQLVMFFLQLFVGFTIGYYTAEERRIQKEMKESNDRFMAAVDRYLEAKKDEVDNSPKVEPKAQPVEPTTQAATQVEKRAFKYFDNKKKERQDGKTTA